MWGGGNSVVIKGTDKIIYSLEVINMGKNCSLKIGSNFFQTGSLSIDFTNLDNINVEIGDNCMFGQNVELMLGDHHKILDKDTKEILNTPAKGIKIGDKVWVARNVKIMKETTISNNTVVATGSIVTKSFDKEYTIIGGAPAKIIKENVIWEK